MIFCVSSKNESKYEREIDCCDKFVVLGLVLLYFM